MNRQLAIIIIPFTSGCFSLLFANAMTFHADNPHKDYPKTVEEASRLTSSSMACDSIGSLRFDDDRIITDNDIETLAHKVASVGGTHYVVHDRSPKGSVVDVLVCTSGIKED